MAQKLSKKFALLCSGIMTMQALRLVISTAGFCVVRFHIDCSLFNIFISRLVNAVMMSQLFGNWLGDLIVFAASGKMKLIATMLANWAEYTCFCTALICIVHSECGHLTGFYWSMVIAYFWWKVSEAPATSIAAPDATDYYFAGFTLSGVWAAILKGLVMRCVTDGAKTLHFKSAALGDVNVTLVGARSVKTTIDYRASKWLYIITILVTTLMCLAWTAIAAAVVDVRASVYTTLEAEKTKLATAIRNANVSTWTQVTETKLKVMPMKSETAPGAWLMVTEGQKTAGTSGDWETQANAKTNIEGQITDVKGLIELVQTRGNAQKELWIKTKTGGMVAGKYWGEAVEGLSGVAFGGVLAVPGAMLGAGAGWVVWVCLFGEEARGVVKWCQLIFGVLGAVGGMACGMVPPGDTAEDKIWVASFKWPGPEQNYTTWAAMMGLGAGMAAGATLGLIIGCCTNAKKRGFAAGAFIGSFAGLWTGEIVNGCLTWENPQTGSVGAVNTDGAAKNYEQYVAACGVLIVVAGLGTVYSIYPGMAPCSITQFQYFNIIDILILILSSIGPLVIMGVDLADQDWKLGKVITGSPAYLGKTDDKKGWREKWMWSAIAVAVLMTIATLICEILVLDIMQHPFTKMAHKVTTSGWRACTLTILMVSFQLTSTGVGFACVAAGSGFNDGVVNANSTIVLWTIECCGVLGEGYQTELKKYEPGKWPTQGMGKWDTYWWWNGKTFKNAWQIWCCIGTKDLRRDIMLCRQ